MYAAGTVFVFSFRVELITAFGKRLIQIHGGSRWVPRVPT